MSSQEIIGTDLAVELTAEIVAAYVQKNAVPAPELPRLIEAIHESLTGLGKPTVEKTEETAGKPKPAVPIKKSVTPDYIISLEDGKKFKSLKRHLQTSYGMSPDQYREKWGLPKDYPMVAPNYAAARSSLARTMGLGRKAREEAEQAGSGAASAAETRRKPGRKPKASAET